MMSLLSELRLGKVLRVAAAGVLVAWITIEAASVLMPAFGAPDWAFQIYGLAVFAGFFAAAGDGQANCDNARAVAAGRGRWRPRQRRERTNVRSDVVNFCSNPLQN